MTDANAGARHHDNDAFVGTSGPQSPTPNSVQPYHTLPPLWRFGEEFGCLGASGETRKDMQVCVACEAHHVSLLVCLARIRKTA